MIFTIADAIDGGREEENKKRRLDATYTIIGSGFKDKDWGTSKTNKPVWEQEARDDSGQRRFHGAFTGGFSAGYHNTVGSEEAWTPASFVSSRTSKAKRVEQTVDSFMDDEDRSEMFSEGLAAAKKFNGFFTTADEIAERSSKKGKGAELGETTTTRPATVTDGAGDIGLVTPTHKTIGTYLLKKMGWMRGPNSLVKRSAEKATFGPKFTHEEIEERNEELFREGRIDSDDDDGDDDVGGCAHVVDVVPKNDSYGIGFDPSEAIPEYNEMKVLRETMAYAGTSSLSQEQKGLRKKMPLGSGFGLSVLEDDDDGDIYSQESFDMYDKEIGGTQRAIEMQKNAYTQYALEKIREEEERQKHANEARSSSTGSGDVLSGFVCETKAPPRRKTWFKPPEVPKDFVPYHYFTEDPVDAIPPPLLKILTPQMRTFLLGEKPLPRTPHDSVLNFLTIEDRSRILGLDEKPTDKDRNKKRDKNTDEPSRPPTDIKLPDAVLDAPTRVIYKGDPQKQRRFELFLDDQRKRRMRDSDGCCGEKPSKEQHQLQPPDGLSSWAWEEEKLEFMSNAIMMKPVEGPLADTFAPSGSSFSATEKVVPVKVQKDAAQDKLDKAVEKKMYGKLTRTEFRWNPNALLCKRFNVPRPRQNVPDGLEQDSVSVALTKALPLDMFAAPTQAGLASNSNYNELLDEIEVRRQKCGMDSKKDRVAKVEEGAAVKDADAEVDERDGRTVEMKLMKEKEEEEEEKPSIDLFKAIFEDSDDEEEENGEERETKNVNEMIPNEIENGISMIKEKNQTNKNEGGEGDDDDDDNDEISFGPEMPPQLSLTKESDGEKGYKDMPPPLKRVKREKYDDSSSDSSDGYSSSNDNKKEHKSHRRKSDHHHHHRHKINHGRHKHKRHHSHKNHHHHEK